MAPRLIPAARRRWYLALIGLAATALMCWHALGASGVFYTQVYLVFLPPQGEANPNALIGANNQSVVDMAGIVGRIVAQHAGPQPASDQVTILGEGISDGYIVRQPNDGGQYNVQFDRPVLDVQVSGPSAQSVTIKLADVVKTINSELTARQAAAGTPPGSMIQTRLSPSNADLYFVKGSRIRALMASLLLGLGLTAAAIALFERLLARRIRLR